MAIIPVMAMIVSVTWPMVLMLDGLPCAFERSELFPRAWRREIFRLSRPSIAAPIFAIIASALPAIMLVYSWYLSVGCLLYLLLALLVQE